MVRLFLGLYFLSPTQPKTLSLGWAKIDTCIRSHRCNLPMHMAAAGGKGAASRSGQTKIGKERSDGGAHCGGGWFRWYWWVKVFDNELQVFVLLFYFSFHFIAAHFYYFSFSTDLIFLDEEQRRWAISNEMVLKDLQYWAIIKFVNLVLKN